MLTIVLSVGDRMAPQRCPVPISSMCEYSASGAKRDFVGMIKEKTMATHSSTLAWKIPWTEEPGELPSLGSHRVAHD